MQVQGFSQTFVTPLLRRWGAVVALGVVMAAIGLLLLFNLFDAVKTLVEYKLFAEERASQAEKFQAELAKGDNDYCAVLVAFNSLLQIVLFAPFAVFYVQIVSHGEKTSVSYEKVAQSVGVFLGIPLGAAILTRLGLKPLLHFAPTRGTMSFVRGWLAVAAGSVQRYVPPMPVTSGSDAGHDTVGYGMLEPPWPTGDFMPFADPPSPMPT